MYIVLFHQHIYKKKKYIYICIGSKKYVISLTFQYKWKGDKSLILKNCSQKAALCEHEAHAIFG